MIKETLSSLTLKINNTSSKVVYLCIIASIESNYSQSATIYEWMSNLMANVSSKREKRKRYESHPNLSSNFQNRTTGTVKLSYLKVMNKSWKYLSALIPSKIRQHLASIDCSLRQTKQAMHLFSTLLTKEDKDPFNHKSRTVWKIIMPHNKQMSWHINKRNLRKWSHLNLDLWWKIITIHAKKSLSLNKHWSSIRSYGTLPGRAARIRRQHKGEYTILKFLLLINQLY